MAEKSEKYRSIIKFENKSLEEQKQLANYIKTTHSQLRNESEILGAAEAWKVHVKQNEKLKHYAECMYKLATKHWDQRSKSRTDPITHCRIEWIKNQCKKYFLNGGIKKFDDKEVYIFNKNNQKLNENSINNLTIKRLISSPINILDVGSCYNPFSSEPLFSVTAIDIAPYSNDVMKCDFLSLNVGSEEVFSEDKKCLIELPKNSYDAVIFSLFLEYIPCPEQRFLSCKKAYALLKNGGLLLIATPDSKHEGANTKIINTSWKIVLANLGFMRICYQKLPHLHCLIFRKCYYKDAALMQVDHKKISNEIITSNKICIPQDFTLKSNMKSSKILPEHYEHNDEELTTFFLELPNQDD